MQELSRNKVNFLLHQYLKFSLISLHPKEFRNYYYSLGKLQGLEISEDNSKLVRGWRRNFGDRKKILQSSGMEDKWNSGGYGDIDIVDDSTIRVFGSSDSMKVPDIGKRVCYYNSGLLSGYVSNVLGEKVRFRENRCVSQGESFCEFSVSQRKLPSISVKDAEKARKRIIENIGDHLEEPYERNVAVDIGGFLNSLSSLRGVRSLMSSIGRDFGFLVGKEIKEINFEDYLEQFGSLLSSLGTGKFDIAKMDPLAVDFDVYDSPFVHEEWEDSSCHFLTGALRGAMEEFTNTSWHAHESECASQGNASCEIKCRNV